MMDAKRSGPAPGGLAPASSAEQEVLSPSPIKYSSSASHSAAGEWRAPPTVRERETATQPRNVTGAAFSLASPPPPEAPKLKHETLLGRLLGADGHSANSTGGAAAGAADRTVQVHWPRPAEFWTKLEELKKHKSFAESYVNKLATFKPKPGQQKVVDNVRSHLLMLLVFLGETQENHKPRVPHPLRILRKCEGVLTVVLKKCAEAVSSAADSGIMRRRTPPHTSVRNSNLPPLPYDPHALHWNEQRSRNREDRYCYCGTNKQDPCLLCTVCKNYFHHSCTKAVPGERYNLIGAHCPIALVPIAFC